MKSRSFAWILFSMFASCVCFYSVQAANSGQIPNFRPGSSNRSADDPPTENESQLVDGLLDLLVEETPQPSTDLEHPLAQVHQLMQGATEMLRLGNSIQEASQMQKNILGKLDDLIEQWQRPTDSSQSNTASSSSEWNEEASFRANPELVQSQVDPRQNQAEGSEPIATAQATNETESLAEPSNDDFTLDASGVPGKSGKGEKSEVSLSSPAELQQSVWGHLPERVRSQMQSRMVEQFLPDYRQQLEAYYRAMLARELER